MNNISNPIKYAEFYSPLYNFRYPKSFNDIDCHYIDCHDIDKIINYYHNSDNFFASEKFKKELYETVYHKKHRNVGLFIGMNLNKHWELLNREELDKPFSYNLNSNKKPNPKIITKSWINKNINIYPGS